LGVAMYLFFVSGDLLKYVRISRYHCFQPTNDESTRQGLTPISRTSSFS